MATRRGQLVCILSAKSCWLIVYKSLWLSELHRQLSNCQDSPLINEESKAISDRYWDSFATMTESELVRVYYRPVKFTLKRIR